MIACWYKTYIRRFGEETKKKKVTCTARPEVYFTYSEHATQTSPPHHPPALIYGFSGGKKKTQIFASFATNGNIARVKILP
jgi:hypothetical protein